MQLYFCTVNIRKYRIPNELPDCFIIQTNQLKCISGGKDDNLTPPPPPSPTVTVVGGGNSSVAGGAVIGSFPITTNTTAGTYVTANTVNGVTGMGASITHRF